MKIAIPVNSNNADTTVCVSFGRAPYFAFYDTETKKTAYIENGAAQSQGGAGIKAAQLIVDGGAQVLISPRLGENAAAVINAAKITLFISTKNSVRENIDAAISGKLEPLSDIHPGFHGHGGK